MILPLTVLLIQLIPGPVFADWELMPPASARDRKLSELKPADSMQGQPSSNLNRPIKTITFYYPEGHFQAGHQRPIMVANVSSSNGVSFLLRIPEETATADKIEKTNSFLATRELSRQELSDAVPEIMRIGGISKGVWWASTCSQLLSVAALGSFASDYSFGGFILTMGAIGSYGVSLLKRADSSYTRAITKEGALIFQEAMEVVESLAFPANQIQSKRFETKTGMVVEKFSDTEIAVYLSPKSKTWRKWTTELLSIFSLGTVQLGN